MEINLKPETLFNRYIALPQDHGSWVFLLSPLLIGLFAGGSWSAASVLLTLAALAGFLIRQPVTTAVKIYSGRRARRELPAAFFWTGIYSLCGLAALAGLIALGYGYLLYLALPGVPVFAWHLALVSRRAERRQLGIELIASGVLALAAPAAFWVGVGNPHPAGWLLWALTWLQSAASIVYAYLRLEQREWKQIPGLPVRLKRAARALAYTSFNLALSGGLALASAVPAWLVLPFGFQWAESVWGALRPALAVRPTAIGMRQLIVSTIFTLLFILAWVR